MPEDIKSEDIDAIKEILNIGIGRSAQMLNCFTKSHITLSIPEVRIFDTENLKKGNEKYLDEESAAVRLEFMGIFSGITAVAFPKDSVAKLVMAMTGEAAGTPELDSLRIETLKEVGNIIINGVMGSISNILKTHLNYAIPYYEEGSIIDMIKAEKKIYDNKVLMAMACFTIKDLNVEGNIFMLLELGSLEILIENINKI
ncbi:MAG: chemotaxis protein CheC [Methanomicrobiaceae archaeon]|nr:chemotaxis protein CheC [Methanomicrobiaceae archaeon]